jgi:hypothetical protein
LKPSSCYSFLKTNREEKGMNRVITWVKSIRLDRILTAFLASVLLLVSTACNSSKVLAKTADDARKEVPSAAVTNTYKGGMNDYSDVDPRRDTSEAKAKAKTLVKNAQQNINEKSVDSPGQYVENYRSGTPLGERVRRIGEDVSESTGEVVKGAAKGTQKGLQNIKENAQQAPGYVKGAAQETVDLDKSQSNANHSMNSPREALGSAAEAGKNIGDKVQGAAQDAADAVKSKVSRDFNRAQRAADRAADALD